MVLVLISGLLTIALVVFVFWFVVTIPRHFESKITHSTEVKSDEN